MTASLISRLFEAQDGKCFHCLRWMRDTPWRESNPFGWTREHVFPKARGGRGMGNNVVLAHKSCNVARGSPTPTDVEIIRTIRIYRSIGLKPFDMLSPPEGVKAQIAAIVARLDRAEGAAP